MPVLPAGARWSAAELAAEARAGQKLLFRFIQAGLLRSPGKGPGPRFDFEARTRFLAAVRMRRSGYAAPLIKQLFERFTPLDFERWSGLTQPPAPAVAAPESEAKRPPPRPAEAEGPPLWARVTLAPGLELHVALRDHDLASLEPVLAALRGAVKP